MNERAPVDTDELYRRWRRLGWDVAAGDISGPVDPELTIVQTTHACRYDDRLLECLLTWVRDYHDLINNKRLLRLVDQADSAVLGAVFEIAMAHGAGPNLRTITSKCRPCKPVQLLLHDLAAIEPVREQEMAHGLAVYRRWGLHCTMLAFYDDAMRTRDWVLGQNPLLATRAFLGANMRGEIVWHLRHHAASAIRPLALSIGYAYSAVHDEVGRMVANGLIAAQPGSPNALQLTERTRRVLDALAV
jgi:hypothetical protein